MPSAPPSLRVYALAKQLPGLWSSTDLLAVDGQLLVELTVYADEENRVANEQRERQARDSGAGRSKVGRFRRRGR